MEKKLKLNERWENVPFILSAKEIVLSYNISSVKLLLKSFIKIMALSAVRNFAIIRKCFPTARNIFSNHCVSVFRIGENVSNARTITRSLFFLCRRSDNPLDVLGSYSVSSPASSKCSCGCNMHTQGKEIGDKELTAFLEEEITTETKSQKNLVVPVLEEFNCQYKGAEVTLTKKLNNEVISIKTNVNHSVDAAEVEPDPENPKEDEVAEMKAKPDFTVEIIKGKRVLAFECCFCDPLTEGEGAYSDLFQISEISLYENEAEDSTYSVSGDIMDGYLYDLLMNYLEERGVSNDFIEKLGALLTSYEHRLYVGLLQGMKKFIEK